MVLLSHEDLEKLDSSNREELASSDIAVQSLQHFILDEDPPRPNAVSGVETGEMIEVLADRMGALLHLFPEGPVEVAEKWARNVSARQWLMVIVGNNQLLDEFQDRLDEALVLGRHHQLEEDLREGELRRNE